MTTPENSHASAPVGEPDGERFLQDLDAALQGHEPDGAHAGTARFAAQLAGVLQSQDAAAPENLRQKIESQTPNAKDRKPSTVVRMDRALRRYRMGTLDIAAIVALAIFGFLIWHSLRKETIAQPDDTSPKTERLAAEDGKPPVPKPETPDATPSPKVAEEEPWKKDIRAKLERKVSFDFVDTPLAEAIAFFGNLSNATIILDPKFASDKTTITLRGTDMSLATALQWTLRLADLRMGLRDNVIFVSKSITEPIEMRVLDVSKLPISSELIAKVVKQVQFDPPFTPQSEASIEAIRGLLKIAQTRESYTRIFAMLSVIREQAASGRIDFHTEAPPAWKKAIAEKLKRKVSFEFADTPLTEVLGFLQTLTNLPLVVDPHTIQQQTPTITLKVTDMEIGTALEWILRLADLNSSLQNEAIFISKSAPIARVLVGYNVSEITKIHGLSEDEIAKMIESTIEPGAWFGADGTSISFGDGWVFVSQTRDNQAKVQSLLEKIAHPEKP